MPLLKKTISKQNLDQYTVLINDIDPNSQYFKITNLPDTFTGGKNAFLIGGSIQLVPDTLVKIEIKDAAGNTVYCEPAAGIPEYYEGTSKVVSVHVYPDTAFGPATITILGELSSYIVDQLNVPIPKNWEGKYNVKWQKTININPFLQNTTPIRFYRRPSIEITESILPIYNREVFTKTVSGSINGTSIIPIQDSDYKTYKGALAYELSTTASFFSQSMEGETITIRGLLYDYKPIISDVTSDKKAFVNIPYFITASNSPSFQQIKNFTEVPFTMSYNETVNLYNSNVSSSFATIKITDLETFTGDAARIKVYASSRNDLADFQLLEDVLLESNELLQVNEFDGALNVRTGIFSQAVLDEFWQVENLNTTTTPEIDNALLLKSVKLKPAVDTQSIINATGRFKFTTKDTLSFNKFTQYQLDFTPLMSSSLGYALLEVYGSGSAFVPQDNTTNYGKLIGELETNSPFRKYEKQQINFYADSTADGKIVFLVKGGTWQIGNVSLRAAQESSFSPNEVTLVANVPTKINNETFDFKFEIYDINNNYVPIDLKGVATFKGGNDVQIARDLLLNVSNQYFNFTTSSVFPSAITIDYQKIGLTGSVTFTSAAIDTAGGPIPDQPNYPGGLETIDTDTVKLTIDNFTGSLQSKVGAIAYTASCEDIKRYFTIYRVDQGAPAYLFYATADKNNFTFNPDDNYQSVITDDYIDIRLVQQNLPSLSPMGLVLKKKAEVGNPPDLTTIGTVGNATVYRLYVTSSTHPSSLDGYYYALGQSTYDFELNTINGKFTSSVTIDAIAKGDKAKAVIATSDKNQFFYNMADLSPTPSIQTANILVKRINLGSLTTPITVNSGSGKPPLTLINNNIGNGVAQFEISTTKYNYAAGITKYDFTGSDLNGTQYYDELTFSTVVPDVAVGIYATNENATLTARSTGFVATESFAATSGSVYVNVGPTSVPFSQWPLVNNSFSASVLNGSELKTSGAFTIPDPFDINKVIYGIKRLDSDSGSFTLKVDYKDGRGSASSYTKAITYGKAKKAAPVLNFSLTNTNQTAVAFSTGVQSSSFQDAKITVTETYDGVTKTLTPTGTTTSGTSGYTGASISDQSTIAFGNLAQGSDSASVAVATTVVDSEGVARTLGGTATISKIKKAAPLVDVQISPLTQTIATDSRGSGSTAPANIAVSITEIQSGFSNNISTFSIVASAAGFVSNNLAVSPTTLTQTNTVTFSGTEGIPSKMPGNTATVNITVNYTDSDNNSVTKTFKSTVTKAKSSPPVTTISVTPQSQTVQKSSTTYGTPSTVTISVNEGGGNYTYSNANPMPASSFKITEVTGVNGTPSNYTSGVVQPTTPTGDTGTSCSATITYVNSEGTITTGKVINFGVGVAIQGTDGGNGPGVVFRGQWAQSTQYFYTAGLRQDVVKGNDGQFYACKLGYTSGADNSTRPNDGASYATYWQAFGATFNSVATGILLTDFSTVNNGMVLGTIGSTSGYFRSADATSLTVGTGFYIDVNGNMRFGTATGAGTPKYIYWDSGAGTLTIKGDIAGGTTFAGAISSTATITGGTISGGTITGGVIDIGGNDTTSFHIDASGNMWLGSATYAAAPFRVSSDGNVDVGGTDASSFHIDNAGNIWSGASAFASGIFKVSNGGALEASSVTISGGSVGTAAGTVTVGGFSADDSYFWSGTKKTTVGFSNDGITLAATGEIRTKTFYTTATGDAYFKGRVLTADGTTYSSVNNVLPIDQYGKLIKPPDTPNGGAGLYIGNDKLGYYNGSSWRALMQNDGTFYLGGTSGGQSSAAGLAWNGSSLSLNGAIYATGGTIGGWSIGNGAIYNNGYSSSGGVDINATSKAITIYDSSGVPRVFLNTNASLSDLTAGDAGGTNSISRPGTAATTTIVNSSRTISTIIIGSFTAASGKLWTVAATWSGNSSLLFATISNVTLASNGSPTTLGSFSCRVKIRLVGTSVVDLLDTGAMGGGPTTTAYYPVGIDQSNSYTFAGDNGNWYVEAQLVFSAQNSGNTGPVNADVSYYQPTTTVDYGAAVGASELLPGGLQVVYSSGRYLKVPRTASGTFVDIKGGFAADAKSFKITHPLDENKWLYHSSIEGPRIDNLYRGYIDLINGTATINLDEISNMTSGTWVLLNRDPQFFLQNMTGWDRVKGYIIGNQLFIECENSESTDRISYMVIGERQDDTIKQVWATDDSGRLITERFKSEDT